MYIALHAAAAHNYSLAQVLHAHDSFRAMHSGVLAKHKQDSYMNPQTNRHPLLLLQQHTLAIVYIPCSVGNHKRDQSGLRYINTRTRTCIHVQL